MKKIILLHLLLFAMLQLVAQSKTVRIHGIVLDTSVKTVEIIHPADDQLSKWEHTKLNVENGAFSTSIQIPFPAQISITYANRIFDQYVYSDAEILIDSVGVAHMSGSPIHDEYENEFLPFFQSNDQVRDSLRSWYDSYYQKYDGEFPKSIKDSLNLLLEKYYAQRAKLLEEYIKLHPDSYVVLWYMSDLIASTPVTQYVDFERLFLSFSNEMQQRSFINVLKERIKGAARMQVGQSFPKEFFKGYEQMQSIIRDNNQYYLIDFWYSHCGPCIAGFPRLKEIYAQYHGRGFDIVSISVDKQKDEKDYISAMKKYGLTWNHVWDKDGVTAEKFNIHLFPTYMLVDKNDKIINSDIRDSELAAFLKEKL